MTDRIGVSEFLDACTRGRLQFLHFFLERVASRLLGRGELRLVRPIASSSRAVSASIRAVSAASCAFETRLRGGELGRVRPVFIGISLLGELCLPAAQWRLAVRPEKTLVPSGRPLPSREVPVPKPAVCELVIRPRLRPSNSGHRVTNDVTGRGVDVRRIVGGFECLEAAWIPNPNGSFRQGQMPR